LRDGILPEQTLIHALVGGGVDEGAVGVVRGGMGGAGIGTSS